MLKVAGYCRVSTDQADQANSLASQQRFFREYISSHPGWELQEIYADEGITGTSTRKRHQFNRMINDAYSGAFQMVITKEVSRFSRNILDTITYTRELKALGIGVIFLSDGFCSLDADAELRLSIMGSIAQEESRKTSTRVKWGQARQMERGVVFGRSLLGYDVKDGALTVEPAGAEIVRQIFYKYGVEKKGSGVIARELQEAGFLSKGKGSGWTSSSILKILKNEKYVGDLVQKKTFTPNYLTHKKKYNHGEEALIILKDHHEAIISRALWDLVQQEIRQRNRKNQSATAHSSRYLFSGKIVCGECGARFISRIRKRKDGSSYRRWICCSTAKSGHAKEAQRAGCGVGKVIRDDLAAEMLVCTVGKIPENTEKIIKNVTMLAANAIFSSQGCYENPEKIRSAVLQAEELKESAIHAYLAGMISQAEFLQMKTRYDREIKILQDKLKAAQQLHIRSIQEITEELYPRVEGIMRCSAPSEAYLKALLDTMTVHKDGTVEVTLCEGAAHERFQLIKG